MMNQIYKTLGIDLNSKEETYTMVAHNLKVFSSYKNAERHLLLKFPKENSVCVRVEVNDVQTRINYN